MTEPDRPIFFTADTHFDHPGILKHRPFDSLEEMNQELIDRWNSVVGPKDIVWHLGDFCWRPKMIEHFLGQLNGFIHLILGNHDPEKPAGLQRKGFVSVRHAHYLRLGERRIYLHHYACRVWRRSHHGSWHLYGHSHGDLPGLGYSTDVGVDARDFTPVSLAQLDELFAEPHEPQRHHVSHVTKTISICPCCGDSHEDLEFRSFTRLGSSGCWALCPATGEPIILDEIRKEQEHG